MSRPQFIPFRSRFVPLIKEGKKTCTARTRKYGTPGDVVESTAGPLRILLVERISLSFVRDQWWREEGMESPGAFVRTWERLHPRVGFDGEQRVWLHVFERVTP